MSLRGVRENEHGEFVEDFESRINTLEQEKKSLKEENDRLILQLQKEREMYEKVRKELSGMRAVEQWG